jgi:uncharacterized protein YyaL (SSP411 family)
MFRFSPRPNAAHNIRWREWGEPAFQEARDQNKPLALFITAFWCGFCQRMDETSLSDEQIIALLNGLFIPIRVEEAQRPDIDLRYNQDGWPTIAFLTPGGTHLASVNYTPPEEFVGLLARVVNYYQENAASLLEAESLDDGAAGDAGLPHEPAPLTPELAEEVAGMLEGLADPEYGGFGGDMKMLHTEANDFFLQRFAAIGDALYLEHVLLTLRRLRESPTFHTKDGGFYRYSSKRDWREPHPEKLLGDQAALLRNYLQAYLLTDDSFFRDTAESLVDYMETSLSGDAGRPFFFGCQDYVRFEANGSTEPKSLIDTFIYCDANAHAASAYFDAWWLLGREDCGRRAQAIVDGLWDRFRSPDGSMYHYHDGDMQTPGLLQDLIAIGEALLDAYATLGDAVYLDRAREVAEQIIARHRGVNGGFVDISRRGPANLRFPLALLTQNAGVARLFIRLADLSDAPSYRRWARWALQRFPNSHREHGAFAAGFGHAVAMLFSPPVIMTISGAPGDPTMRSLWRAALRQSRLFSPTLSFSKVPEGLAASVEVTPRAMVTGPAADP